MIMVADALVDCTMSVLQDVGITFLKRKHIK
jgi:hypothetical protein